MAARERIQLRRMLKVVAVVSLVLVAGALHIGMSTARYMKQIIRDQFNDEQLALARALAMRMEADIQDAITDISLLNSMPAIQYYDEEAYDILLLSILPVLNRDNILEIRRIDRDGNIVFVANERGIASKVSSPADQEAGAYLSWAAEPSNRGKTMGTPARPKDPSNDRKLIVADLITPTYEDSSDVRHPRASHRFSGYIRATLDVSHILRRIATPIKSGKSGYAWVLDSAGNFLYHPESSFIGENAFEVRSNRNPSISFAQINAIQRNEMLTGKEGTGTYISGWHRDVIEPMEKLIAYTPLKFQGPYMDYSWAVAVVAPLQEIEGIIGSVYGKQILFEGTAIFMILLGSIVVVLYELRWSTILENEVAAKTEDIRRYAEQLERSESKYRSLVESAEDLIFTLNADGTIKTANQHMSSLWGVSNSVLPGQSIYKFLPVEQADEQLELVRQALRSHKAQSMETTFRIQNEDLWFNIQYIPVKGNDSEVHVLGIARDITERKSLEKQLVNTEKLASLGTLAAGVAHEINNPLGIMLGFCDLLLERADPGTMEYGDLKTIERHGLHCKSIVERLLSFARISEELEEQCDVNSNVLDVMSVVKHTLSMNGIELLSNLSDDLPAVKGDCKGLQQVLLNLISNARYAMNNGGSLNVTTRLAEKPGFVEIVVSDTGCGIKKQFLNKIFDPFFTTKKVGDGTGLGLSVSYGIISKHGGTIECESHTEEDGPEPTGTTFTILLPVSDTTPETAARCQPPTEDA